MIGKTRQDTRQLTHYDAGAGPARGILRTDSASGTFSHSRKSPAAELNPWILHYWMVEWDLEQGRVQTVETLPHPNVQLVFSSQDGSALVHGVHTGKFSRRLQGRARVFGVKFRAGGFFPFLQAPVSSLRGKTIPPGPDDPIKARWMGIFGGAGIHGVDPSEYGSLGSAASHGCVRMRITDVIELFDRVEVGTPVHIA